MRRFIVIVVSVLLAVFFCAKSDAQNRDGKVQIERFILEQIEFLKEIEKSLPKIKTREELDKINKDIYSHDTRFDTFFSTHSYEFSEDSSVMDSLTEYKQMRNELDEKLTLVSSYIDAREAVDEAKKTLEQADSIYAVYVKQAKRYSLVKHTAKLLKKVKSREKITYAKISAKYETAVATAEASPALEEDMSLLEDKMADISTKSELVQQLEYTPLIQKVKDWLVSLAAVAILLMFVSMVQSRISAYKKMKENLKKMQNAMNENDQDIPSI